MFKLLPCLFAAVGCSTSFAASQAPPQIVPRTVQVTTAPGVSLEVFDWGGRGRPLVFLAGGGHSAREFEEFAPRFTQAHQEVAISRRGSGASSDVAPERLDELVDDVVAVLDSLDLPSAVLVGHSFAGMEMALFGEKHPERCAGLVYLDAAYDYTDPEIVRIFTETPPPQAPPMLAADPASTAAVRAYVQRTSGHMLPESEIRATRTFDAGGRLVGHEPSATQMRMGALNRAPRWAIRCPSLGIFAIPTPLASRGPSWYRELDAAGRERGDAYVRAFSRWTAAQRAQFGQVPGNRVIEFDSSSHYFFLEKPEESSRMILDFAASLP